MIRRLSGLIAALALASHAQAQVSPAQMGITPTTTPEVVQVLDASRTWVPIGSVDPSAHVFTLTSGGVVPTLAGLKALVGSAAGQTVTRQGYASAGDGGKADYVWSTSACSLNSGAGDNGAQVKPTAGGGCWNIAPQAAGFDIRIWGAVADNATDVGQFVQAAYNANVGCIYIPPGVYLLASAVTMSAQPPCFVGAGWNEAVNGAAKSGTWIHISNTSLTPITISSIVGQGGVPGFSRLAFYEDQPAPGVGWTPSAYQYIFNLTNNLGRIDFDNIMFYNVTHCINISASARNHITNIYGQPVGNCITYDKETDVFTLRDVELWPFWSNDANVVGYTIANVDPLIFLRADSPYADNIFTYGYHSTLAFGQSSAGVTTGAQFGSIQSDASTYSVWIKPGTSNVQFQMANLRASGLNYPSGVIAGSESYRDEGASTTASFANIECYGAGSNCVHLVGSNDALQYGNLLAWNYNNDNNGSTAINVAAGSFVFGANQPSVTLPQNGATTIPQSGTGNRYAVRGVRQRWTPTLAGSTTPGSPTYSYNVGNYWYDGSMMRLTFNIYATALGGAVGNLLLTGLPATANAGLNYNTSCFFSYWSGVTLTAGYTTVTGLYAGGGANQIQLLQMASSAGASFVTAAMISGGLYLQGECTLPVGQ